MTSKQREISAIFDIIRKLKKDSKAIIYISHRLAEIFQIANRASVLKDDECMGTEMVKDIDQNWIVKKWLVERYILNLIREILKKV